MQKMIIFLKTEERGATAIEYALLAAMIAMAIVGAAAALGTTLTEAYQRVVNMFS